MNVDIENGGKLEIGKFLMTKGPLYFKSIGNGKLEIGNNVFFNHNCSLTVMEYIKTGNNSMFGNNLVIVNHNHLSENDIYENKYVTDSIILGNNAWWGTNVTILKEVTIGDNAVITVGFVANRDVSVNEICGGIPAKKIK